jgi:hypothetical protein
MKEQLEYLIAKLDFFLEELNTVEPAESISKMLEAGYITKDDFLDLLQTFRAIDEIYEDDTKRPFFDEDLQTKIDSCRDPVLQWMEGIYNNRDKLTVLDYEPIAMEVIKFPNVLTEATKEQMARIEHHLLTVILQKSVN